MINIFTDTVDVFFNYTTDVFSNFMDLSREFIFNSEDSSTQVKDESLSSIDIGKKKHLF